MTAGSTRIAVVGTNLWAAKGWRDALKIEWDDTNAEMRGSAELLAEYRSLLDQPGLSARNDGDAETAIAGAAKIVTADYEFPYLAHAPMEPLNCVVELSEHRCEIWSGSQSQTIDQLIAARITGLDPAQIEIHTTLAGGSFGRRADPNWSTMRYRSQRPLAGAHRFVLFGPAKTIFRVVNIAAVRASPARGADRTGRVVGRHHRIVGQPISTGAGIDTSSVQGAATLPYAISNLAVDLHTTAVGIPVMWWRSVGSSHNAYATETFIDELAHAVGKDPVALRLALLERDSPSANVLRLAAAKANWGRALPPGHFHGVAVHEWAGSHVAQIAEITLAKPGVVKVERVACAVDCGTAINPDIVAAQMEGGIAYGLGAALYNAITLTEGRVDQTNFHDYKPLRMSDMPKVSVHIVPSSRPPTGVGEAGVPPIAPAVANALFAATGKRVRTLPFEGQNLRRA